MTTNDPIKADAREGGGDTAFTHCDDYIDDETKPACLRAFLNHVRSPAHGSLRDEPRPTLFADYKGKRVRVTMASRFGDVGISRDLSRERGYDARVDLAELSNFAETPSGHAHGCDFHCEQYPHECTCGTDRPNDTSEAPCPLQRPIITGE